MWVPFRDTKREVEIEITVWEFIASTILQVSSIIWFWIVGIIEGDIIIVGCKLIKNEA